MNSRVAFLILAIAYVQMARTSPEEGTNYQDAQKRFAFSYPSSFGATSPGTNDGFGDRISAVRFAGFSAGIPGGELVLGGEAVVTAAFPLVDLQAAGGLYDPLTPAVSAVDDTLMHVRRDSVRF